MRTLSLILMLMAAGCAVGQTAVRHVRFAAARCSDATVGLRWADSLRFEAVIPAQTADNSLTGAELRCRYYRGDSLIAESRAPVSYRRQAAVSLVLRAWPEGAAAEAGSDGAAVLIPVVFSASDADGIDFDNPAGLTVLRNTLLADSIPAPKYFAGPLPGAGTSADPMLAVWHYLDRNTDPELAELREHYILATVAGTTGGYDIVCLPAGADASAAPRLKGHLEPTPFRNHYALRWLDAAGRSVDAEAYADVDPEERILTLTFPLLNSSLRFYAR